MIHANTALSNDDLYTKLLEAIKTEGEKNKNEIAREIQSENHKLLQKLDEQNKQLLDLDVRSKKLEARCVSLERRLRKNNIIIFGLVKADEEIDLLDFTIKAINELLDIEIRTSEVNNIYQIRNSNDAPIKVEFVSNLKKAVILKNCSKLKNSNISIAQDLCYEDREDIGILRKYLKLARSQNHTAKIKGRNLIINNVEYTTEKLKEMNAMENDDIAIFQETFLKSQSTSNISTYTGNAPSGSLQNLNQTNKLFAKGRRNLATVGSTPINKSGTSIVTRLQSVRK